MKKKKLHLKELKIKSFVTTIDDATQSEIKGGRVERGERINLFSRIKVRRHAWTVSEIRRVQNRNININEDIV